MRRRPGQTQEQHILHNTNSVKWPRSPSVRLAQWTERAPGVGEVMSSIPVGYSESLLRSRCLGSSRNAPSSWRLGLRLMSRARVLLIISSFTNFSSFNLGTTWVQEIVWQIFNEGQVKGSHVMERVPFLEWATNTSVVTQPDINTLSSPRIIKTHLPYHTTPKSANEDTKCKYIYVARNPKDVAVSYFKFWKSSTIIGNGYNGPWEFCAKLFVEGNSKYVCNQFSSREQTRPD